MLALFASLANFLTYNDYPLWAPESGFIALHLAGIAVIYGLLYGAGGNIMRVILEFALVYAAIDFNVSNMLVPAIGTVVAMIVLNRHMLPMLAVISAVVLLSAVTGLSAGSSTRASLQVAGPASGDSVARPLPPVIVHLILDEHIGVEGIPAALPEGARMRDKMRRFYLSRGFSLFGRAHSEFMRTVNSLPHMLNFGERSPSNGALTDGISLRRNAYFERLADLGYRIKVYQNDYIDYCVHGGVAECRTAPAAAMAPIADSGLTMRDRALVLSYGFAALSDTGVRLYNLAALALSRAGYRPPFFTTLRYSPSSLGALGLFDKLNGDIRAAKPGDAYFAHLLLPHYPHALRADCSVKPIADWRRRKITQHDDVDALAAYFEQLRCVMHKLDATIEAVDRATDGNAVILVHGDHGSRMTVIDPAAGNVGRFSDRDMISTYSTLFAVRIPGVEAAYHEAPHALAALFSSLVVSEFRGMTNIEDPEENGTVVLENRSWEPGDRHPLPDGWR